MEIKDQENLSVAEQNGSSKDNSDKKAHPWRRCSIGKHFVREHVIHTPPSNIHPNGIVTTIHDHCANNLSRKDELSFDEIQYISKKYFSTLSGLPTAGALTKVFLKADDYDSEIRGWTQYWNDIFKLDDPLDPDFVKALIGTESSFDLKPKGNSKAFGLMQLMPETFKILRDAKGELKDYLVCISHDQYLDMSANICSGVRWLFQKKKLTDSKLKRISTWEEVIIDYKSYCEEIKNKIDPVPMQHLRKFYQILKGK